MIERKVTFNAETAAPSPRYLAAGMAGDSNSRLIRFDVPALTPDQMVFVKIESGGVSDKVRLGCTRTTRGYTAGAYRKTY